jgi:hypothetical protein
VLELLPRARDAPGGASPVPDSLLAAVEADVERFFAAVAAPSPLPARFAGFFADGEEPAPLRPRGAQRCAVLRLLEECLRAERPALTTPLLELGLFHVVADLLLMPHTCNALHMRAASILEWAIGLPYGPASAAPAVHRALLGDAQLVDRLLGLVREHAPPPPPPPDAADAAAAARPRPKPLPCCHAFVMHLGGCLLSAAQREPDIRPLIDACPEWNRFIAPGGPLTLWEQTQSKPLGGTAPTRGSDLDDDDDWAAGPNPWMSDSDDDEEEELDAPTRGSDSDSASHISDETADSATPTTN